MPRYCLLCGSGNDNTTLFCAACGTELVEDEISIIEEKSIETDAVAITRVPAPDGSIGRDERPLMVIPDGTILRTYQVSYLTCGGMGAIYKAVDLNTQKEYVIKEAMSTDSTEKTRFMMALNDEKNRLITLDHPGIVKCHEYFEEGDSYYLVIEYVDGQTLSAVQAGVEPGFVLEVDVLSWAVQLSEILHYLHTRQPPIIYRDLKPSNVMVTHLGKVKLIDFGIARVYKKDKRMDTEIIGTVGFCPPEQYGDGQTDHRSDIYSLGAMMHSLMTNIVPGSQSSNPFEFCSVRMVNPNASRQIEAIIKKATRIEREERYESMEHMWGVLNSAYKNASEQLLGMPRLEVDPVNLDIMRIGIDETRKARFLITNAGKGTLKGTIAPPAMKGISLFPLEINSNKQVVEIEVDGSQVPPYKQQKINIAIKTNGGSFVLPVTFSVGLTPKLAVNVSALQFVLHNDQVSFLKEIILLNKGAATLEGVARCKDPWVILSDKEFRGNFVKLSVQIDPYNLFPGRSYSSKIILNTNGGTKEINIQVFLRLSFAHLEDTLAHIEQGKEKVRLSQMLRDLRVEDPEIRKDMIVSLNEHRYRDLFIPHFMEAMERDSDPDVRETAAEVLYKLQNSETIPSFIEALSDSSPGVRKIAVEALEKLGGEDTFDYVAKLVTDGNAEVRAAATRTVAKFGHKKFVDTITPIGKAVKEMDIETATRGLKSVQNAAKGFWDKFLKKKID